MRRPVCYDVGHALHARPGLHTHAFAAILPFLLRWIMHPRHGLGQAALVLAATLAFPPASLAEGLSKDQVQKLEGGDVIMLQMEKEEGKGYIGGSSISFRGYYIDAPGKA